MPVLEERPRHHILDDEHHRHGGPMLITVEALEFLSRNLARAAVRIRASRHIAQRREYLSFVDTVAVLHDRAAVEDLRTAVEDEQAGRLHEWADVRAELGRGPAPADDDRPR